jgi:hypothetical protein
MTDSPRWDDVDDVPTHCPHCGGSIGPDWWTRAPDATVERWISQGGGCRMDGATHASEAERLLRLFQQTQLRFLNRRIQRKRRDDAYARGRARYITAMAAGRADFAPPDELAFIPPRTRELLGRLHIDTLDDLLRMPRMFYAVGLSYRHMHAIDQALAMIGMRLRKR